MLCCLKTMYFTSHSKNKCSLSFSKLSKQKYIIYMNKIFTLFSSQPEPIWEPAFVFQESACSSKKMSTIYQKYWLPRPNSSNQSHKVVLEMIILFPTYLIGRNFVGRNFRHQTKNSSLSPYEKFGPTKVKVSLNEVQVNLRGKQVT